MRSFTSAVIALVLLAFAVRLPLIVQRCAVDDEAVYSVVANEILDGGKPYADAVERKPPLLFYTYAAVFAVAGEYNWFALHIVAVLWALGTMAGLYVIGRALFDRRTGFAAALLYCLFQPAVSHKNITLNGELLMNLPIVWAWAIAFTWRDSRPLLFISGVLSCAAFLLKQPAAIAAVPLGVYLLTHRDRPLVNFATFCAGFWSALAVAVAILWKQGTLADSIYWTIGDHAPPHFFALRFLRSTLTFAAATLPLLFAAVLSRDFWKTRAAEWRALMLLLIASIIGASAGMRFYSHYYTQLMPALVLLAAPLVAALWPNKSYPLWRVAFAIWLLLTLVAFPIVKWRELSVRASPTEAGDFLLAHRRPDDRLFVWGEVARIYLEARMRPACRYIMTYPLTGYVFGGPIPGLDTRSRILPGAWENLERDFRKHPPDYIVDVQKPAIEWSADYRIADFPVLQRMIDEQFEIAATTAEGIVYRRRTR